MFKYPEMERSNIFALRSQANMEHYYEGLRKKNENFEEDDTRFEKLEASAKKKTFRGLDNELKNEDFQNALEDMGKSNIFAAKTRKNYYDFKNYNPIPGDFYIENENGKKTKILNEEKSHYAG